MALLYGPRLASHGGDGGQRPIAVTSVDFAAGPVDEEVAGEVDLDVDPAATINAVRLAGRIDLAANHALGPTPAVNGDKILPIRAVSGVARATLRWRYRMGAGLGALDLDCDAIAPPDRVGGSLGDG